MSTGDVCRGNTGIRELQRLTIEKPHDPPDRSDEASAREAGPGHGFGPVKVVKDARQNVCKNVFGGAAALHLFGGEVFTLRCLLKIDFVEGNALLLRKANGRARRRADSIKGHRLGRACDFARDIGLTNWQAPRPERQAAWRAKGLDGDALHQIFGGELLLETSLEFGLGAGQHACGNLFATHFE